MSESFLSQEQLTPKAIVKALDRHIVGQLPAKRAVAVALRNRHRRLQVDSELRAEITPKNILMIGPTGVGKTEIARRLAKLANAPFIKIEATKFTEVGYVGRDVESIIRDLIDNAIKLIRNEAMEGVKASADLAAENRILSVLLPTPTGAGSGSEPSQTETGWPIESSKPELILEVPEPESPARQLFREQLRAGELDEKDIELELAVGNIGVEIMAPPGMEEMTNQLQGLFQNLSSERKKRKKLKIKDALRLLREEEASKLINEDEIRTQAVARVEESGIVFLDEIDKVTRRSDQSGGGEVSREGVQRDLLPLIEGCTVSTRYGMVRTDHILFIASGAFHLTKPSDLIPELQGRLPIRVELTALTADDFFKILTEPKAALTKQYQALLQTENVHIEFLESGILRLAELAWRINEQTENIGARRLQTVMERLLEDISFRADEYRDQTISITRDYVDRQLVDLVEDPDLSHFIL